MESQPIARSISIQTKVLMGCKPVRCGDWKGCLDHWPQPARNSQEKVSPKILIGDCSNGMSFNANTNQGRLI